MRSVFAWRHVLWFVPSFALVIIILQLYSYRQHMFPSANKSKPHIVFGILSAENKIELRDAQRKTWLSTAMHSDIPFKLTYKFLIDLPTKNTTEENKIHNDIVYLNVTTHGYAVKFGEKIYIWMKYILANYPDAYLGARIDDDVFLCVPEMFERLDLIKSSKLHYGWWPGPNLEYGLTRRVDEMFLVFGRELIQRITTREYCVDRSTCNMTTQLVDFGWGALSLTMWLSIYDDVDFKTDNDRMIYYGRNNLEENEKKYAPYVKADFCDNWLLYHKATPDIMRKLHSRYQSV